MAGTDRYQDETVAGDSSPVVILARPQLGENIGMVARAMLNCGLVHLRLVSPRDGWPNEMATATASGAVAVLERARRYESLAEATADLNCVFATSTRPRDLAKRVLEPREAAMSARGAIAQGERVGLLFGPEKSGLSNEDLALADAVVSVPLNPAFSSLNLAQAVLILGYEWFLSGREAIPGHLVRSGAARASKAEMDNFCGRLEAALDKAGFLYPPEKRPNMVSNLRALFGRMDLTDPEVKTLHGIISALCATGEKSRGG